MKRILDTVHGYITVTDELIRNIVDTKYFQRLRRIEQTSIRAVYPSARHDRFIHSLGVYHIGCMIARQLYADGKKTDLWGEREDSMNTIVNSYQVACLLHDIAHAPFSHTFEKYYGRKVDLAEKLCGEINNRNFTLDHEDIKKDDRPNYHEYMSAYLAHKEYKKAFEEMNVDGELIARMITGVFYNKEKDTHQIHNCFISLLHGNIIDADRLDYACRDVWASGYCTSSIDLRRLVSALHIKKKDDDFVVCFDCNSINEIEGVINVKDFQVKYVLNHHIVSYEQWLLTKAAEHMSDNFFTLDDEAKRKELSTLSYVVSEAALLSKVEVPNKGVSIMNLSDDDLIFLIKQDENNTFYEEWATRQYKYYPLWKSRDEFYHFYKEVNRQQDLRNDNFEKIIKKVLKEHGISETEVRVTKATFKPRVKLESLYLVVANDIVRYTEIHTDAMGANKEVTFYYVFIAKGERSYEEVRERAKECVHLLEKTMNEMYRKE